MADDPLTHFASVVGFIIEIGRQWTIEYGASLIEANAMLANILSRFAATLLKTTGHLACQMPRLSYRSEANDTTSALGGGLLPGG